MTERRNPGGRFQMSAGRQPHEREIFVEREEQAVPVRGINSSRHPPGRRRDPKMVLGKIVHPLKFFRRDFHKTFRPVFVPFTAGLFQKLVRGRERSGIVEPEHQHELPALRAPDKRILLPAEGERNIGFKLDSALENPDSVDGIVDRPASVPVQFRIVRVEKVTETEPPSLRSLPAALQDNDIPVETAECLGRDTTSVRIHALGFDQSAARVERLMKIHRYTFGLQIRQEISERDQFSAHGVVAMSGPPDSGNEFSPSVLRLSLHSLEVDQQREIPIADGRRCIPVMPGCFPRDVNFLHRLSLSFLPSGFSLRSSSKRAVLLFSLYDISRLKTRCRRLKLIWIIRRFHMDFLTK